MSSRPPNTTYTTDTVDKIKGIGKILKAKLQQANLHTIADVLATHPPSSLSAKVWSSIMKHASTALPHPPPPPIDHRKASNPCESLYGDTWQDKIKTVSALSTTCCVTDMVRHIYESSKAFFADTIYAQNWYFYHDALSLMNSNVTKEWMEKESILSHWILPKNGLNQRTPFCNHPPGNSPELMPMDDSLNKDWADGLKRHQLFTMNLPEDDPKKFSSSTPKRLSSSMRRVWEGCPSSERIVQDVRKVIYDNIPIA